MALPGRNQTFSFKDCRELLNKLEREIERYCDIAGVTESLDGEMLMRHVDQLKDSAFNASVTAWHLTDWVFNDLTMVQRQRLNVNNLSELQCRVRKQCRALYLCRHVATASKHWSVKNYPDPTIRALVECNEVGWAAYFFDDSTKIPADQIFRAALEFWTQLIYGNNVAKENDDGRSVSCS